MFTQSRRLFLKGSAAMGAVLSLATAAFGADPIVIGIPAAQSGPVGVADHQDWTNGAMMAIEELNAKGGVLGRPLEAKIIDLDMLSPEGNVAGFQSLIEGARMRLHLPLPSSPSRPWTQQPLRVFLMCMAIPRRSMLISSRQIRRNIATCFN